jgi:hypothetical protein
VEPVQHQQQQCGAVPGQVSQAIAGQQKNINIMFIAVMVQSRHCCWSCVLHQEVDWWLHPGVAAIKHVAIEPQASYNNGGVHRKVCDTHECCTGAAGVMPGL